MRVLARFQRAALALAIPALLITPIACGGGGGGSSTQASTQEDILTSLRKAPGVVSVTEKASSISGTRFFVLGLTQAENHFATPTPTFTQVVTVLFRSRTAPTTLATTGYSISQNPSEWEPTRILGANQVTMEHRFFNTSTPTDLDWTKLTIQQAAADEHQVVQALKPILTGKWLNTGGSKGGMTALFHRRFYPGDVDATVAYVAPISLTSPDNRYIAFVTSRGTTATQQAIHAWQQAIFDNRAAVLALFEADAANQGETLNDLGADKALEFAVLESPFLIWQYGDASVANQVPGPGATAQQLYDYLNLVNSGVVATWGDSTLAYYQAYYQQCANQLGYPGVDESFTGLSYSGQDVPAAYPPSGADKTWDGGVAMQDIQDWISNTAQKVILIYGENDPWSAGALDVPAAAVARGVHKYIQPLGNHGSKLAGLADADKTEAYGLLSQWMNATVQPVAPAPAAKGFAPGISDTGVLRNPLK